MVNKGRRSKDTSKATPARRAALTMLKTVRQDGVYLSAVVPSIQHHFKLDRSDRAFAYLLAQGVLSLQVTLDSMIDRTLRSSNDIKPDVRDALRIAVYEMLYLGKEAHAAVDQGVELVRALAPRATGVANHVLRRIAEGRDRFPYGDPTSSLETAALFYGFPLWMAHMIAADRGERDTISLMKESIEAAPIWFTPNCCLMTLDELCARLREAEIEFNTCNSLISSDPPSHAPIVQLVERNNVGHPVFQALLAEEKIVISDWAAQSIVARAVDRIPHEHGRVLEIGAGRGTKTLQMQSLCRLNDVHLAAYEMVDVIPAKVEQLETRVKRAGGMVSRAIVHDATKPFPHDQNSFDLVFIDAPCTGVGTLRRHPEIKARLSQDDSAALASIGAAMLDQASKLVRPGGSLLYSTCTVFTEENERVIERFLSSAAGASFSIEPIDNDAMSFFRSPVEQGGPDLHFAALLARSEK